MQYVKSAVQDEGRNIFIKSRVYTDECIEKLKSKEDAYNKMLEAFKIETNLSLKEFGDKLKETDRSIVDRDLAVRDHVRDIEKALLTKIDEIHFKAEKMQEQFRNRSDDSSLDNRSSRVKASIVAAPVIAPTGTDSLTEARSPSPSNMEKQKSRKGISQEQLAQIYETIN